MSKISLYKPFAGWVHFHDNIWVYSDPHFGDVDCILMDPNWPSPEEQVRRINSKVGKKDVLILLGDIGDTRYISQLKGKKILVKGNHDKGDQTYERHTYSQCIGRQAELGWNIPEQRKAKLRELGQDPTFTHAELRVLEDNDVVVMANYDNKLFDEVYSGPIFINNKILLSHEPVKLPFGVNIHGHDHAGVGMPDTYTLDMCASINVCSNVVRYEPQRLDTILKHLKVEDLHRITIDKARGVYTQKSLK